MARDGWLGAVARVTLWGAVDIGGDCGGRPSFRRVDLTRKEKGPGNPRPFVRQIGNDYSRLPMNCSKNMNMFKKFMYRFNAPMIADLPSHS